MSELEIYDTTLREGEQAAGASFSMQDRLKICEILDDFGVDYIELGWPLSSAEILESFKECIEKVEKAKIVAFGSTSISENIQEDKNLNSIVQSGVRYACIVGKTDLEHVEKQLKISPDENLRRIRESIKFLKEKEIEVFYDAEHYFDAFKSDEDYAIKTLIAAIEGGAERIVLCDTKGGSLPDEAKEILKKTQGALIDKELAAKLGVHFHDDCGLALASTLASLPYIKQVQGTINGIGERVGNLNFSEFLPVYIKKMGRMSRVNLVKLKEISEEVFRLAGIDVPEMRAFVGDNAFTHKGGVHTDAESKGVSYEHENPEDFGNKSKILLNTLGGRSCVTQVARELGYNLDKNNPDVKEKITRLFYELRELEKRGYRLGSLKAEQFLLIEKYFGKLNEIFNIRRWEIRSRVEGESEKSIFHMSGSINGEEFEDIHTVEGGPVDAAYKTIIKLLGKRYPQVNRLKLVDFHVSIARSRREESTVRTFITFRDGEEFQTVGVDENILNSAVEALVKGFRYYLNNNKSKFINQNTDI
ncbi:MAG: alpha-isopropylmalate synthase regulatory domain-containing protein [archaeon]